MTDQASKKRGTPSDERLAEMLERRAKAGEAHIKLDNAAYYTKTDAALDREIAARLRSSICNAHEPAKCPTCSGTGQIDGGSDQGDTWTCLDCNPLLES